MTAADLSAEDRLRAIDRLWYVRVNSGSPFLAHTDDAKAMSVLLDGYTHPDTVATHDDDDGETGTGPNETTPR